MQNLRFDYEGRLGRLRAAMTARAELMVVTKSENVRWLTGFHGSFGMVVVTPNSAVLITDGRYALAAEAVLANSNSETRLEISSDVGSLLARLAANASAIALEANHVSWEFARQAKEEWFNAQTVVASVNLVEELRAIKEPVEVEAIKTAATIADQALSSVLPSLVNSPTEAEVAMSLELAMGDAGSEKPAFSTIVAAGLNSALPHHEPSDNRLTTGDLVVIDMGATHHGYCSDMTRTFSLGHPSEQTAKMLTTVQRAHDEAVAVAAADVATRDVDAKARQIIHEAGWAEFFVHPTGHGVGLEIHEPLRLSATSNATLAPGNVVTVEPGVYIPGVGGVRVEDTIEITMDGSRMLTRAQLPTVID